jgi:hypothetical protein
LRYINFSAVRFLYCVFLFGLLLLLLGKYVLD